MRQYRIESKAIICRQTRCQKTLSLLRISLVSLIDQNRFYHNSVRKHFIIFYDMTFNRSQAKSYVFRYLS